VAVTTDQWMKMLRRKLSDVDTAAQRRTDAQLLAAADDARLELAVRAVAGFGEVTVGFNKQDPATYGIQNADDAQMLLLLYSVAHEVLSATYRERVDRGELGISWRSGLEEESTISAERAYRGMLEAVEGQYDQLMLTYQRGTANARKH
jgi:hypothetical protein